MPKSKKPLKKKEDRQAAKKSASGPVSASLVPVLPPAEKALIPYDPLQMYLLEVKRFNLLTREDETQLAIRVRDQNDEKAAYKLVTSNLRLVIKIAMDFHRYWTKNLLDLIQEGNLGLLQAVRKFDPYRGIKFSYYASFWIKAYMLKFIMDNWKLVKIGTTQSQRKLFFNLAKERDKLIAEGFRPEPRLLAERLDVKEEEVVEMSQRLGGWELSLTAPVGDDSGRYSVPFCRTTRAMPRNSSQTPRQKRSCRKNSGNTVRLSPGKRRRYSTPESLRKSP